VPLTLITATGARPEAFALCERWMRAQQYDGDVQWVVIDDGPVPTECTLGQEVLRPQPLWTPGANTQKRNMVVGVDAAKHEHVLIIEDDDYYAPFYLDVMEKRLAGKELVGERDALYYNVRSRMWLDNQNKRHSSLCQTGVGPRALELLRQSCFAVNKFIDVHLWNLAQDLQLPTQLYQRSGLCVGIKGLPGRGGIGIGHKPVIGGRWQRDSDFSVLTAWLGADSEPYARYHTGG
jgi:hypothetical protein